MSRDRVVALITLVTVQVQQAMPEVEIRFPPAQVSSGSFRLLELPPDLCKLIESSADDLRYYMNCHGPCYSTVSDVCPSLVIKGGPEDDAVLCTSDKTYNIRSVTLSNSVLVVSPSPHGGDGNENQVIIQDSLNELLELIPAVPKVHRMNALLKEHEWEEAQEEEQDERSFRVGTVGGGSPSMPSQGLQ